MNHDRVEELLAEAYRGEFERSMVTVADLEEMAVVVATLRLDSEAETARLVAGARELAEGVLAWLESTRPPDRAR